MLKLQSRFDKKAPINVALVSLVFTGCATAPQVTENLVPSNFKQSVEIKDVAGRWLVPVTIEGKQLSLILDTAAAATSLYENERTKPLFKKVDSTTKSRTFNNSKRTVSSKAINSATMSISGLPIQDVKISLFEGEQNPTFPWNREKIDGAIGFDLLNFYDLRIDPKNNTLTFFAPGALAHSISGKFTPINIDKKAPSFEANLSFAGKSDVESITTWIDTGAKTPIRIYTSNDISEHVDPEAKKVYIQNISGVGGYDSVKDVTISSLDGNFAITSDATIKNLKKTETIAIVGRPDLSQNVIEISYRSKFLSIADN